MRFKLFGSKGSLDTTAKDTKKKKEKKKIKEENAIVCTGYRLNNEFDTPPRLRTTHPQTNINNKAPPPFSFPTVNGTVPKPNNPIALQLPQTSKDNVYNGMQLNPIPTETKLPEKPTEVKNSSPPTAPASLNAATKPTDSPEVVLRHKPTNFNTYTTQSDDSDDETANNDNHIKIVTGQTNKDTTTSSSQFSTMDDDDKKSTLIHMTESHDLGRQRYDTSDSEEDEYQEIDLEDGYGTGADIYKTQANTDYSNAAASIFFSDSDTKQSTERKKNIRDRNDDSDNGSQTSA